MGLSSRELHAIKFSQYYNASTDKVMVLSNAAGGVIWVSDPYGGHVADDALIVHHYPIIAKYVPAGSIIFCDKGASHAAVVALALAARHDWRIPPRKTTGERFSRAEVVDQATVGSARVVIENVIGGAHNRLVEGQATCATSPAASRQTKCNLPQRLPLPPIPAVGSASFATACGARCPSMCTRQLSARAFSCATSAPLSAARAALATTSRRPRPTPTASPVGLPRTQRVRRGSRRELKRKHCRRCGFRTG